MELSPFGRVSQKHRDGIRLNHSLVWRTYFLFIIEGLDRVLGFDKESN